MHNYNFIESDDYYDMACEWIKQKDLIKAEDCLKHAIELNPKFTYAYITLSEIYARQKHFHDAIATLKKAHHQDPDFERLIYLMAKYAYKAGDSKNAMKFIIKAYDANPCALYDKVKNIIYNDYHSK